MCDLQRDGDGLAVAHLADDETGRATSLWVDDGYKYLMVYTADAVRDPVRRRASIAIEPMTCPPNALRSGIDLIELDPGDSWTGRWGLAPRLG
jgi:aldose 1-epimerase